MKWLASVSGVGDCCEAGLSRRFPTLTFGLRRTSLRTKRAIAPRLTTVAPPAIVQSKGNEMIERLLPWVVVGFVIGFLGIGLFAPRVWEPSDEVDHLEALDLSQAEQTLLLLACPPATRGGTRRWICDRH